MKQQELISSALCEWVSDYVDKLSYDEKESKERKEGMSKG